MLARLTIQLYAKKPARVTFLSIYHKVFCFTKHYIVSFFNSYEDVIQKTGISTEAREYIRDSSAFHYGLGPAQSNARFLRTRQGFTENTRLTDLPSFVTDLPSYVTVQTGMNSFPVEFMRKFLEFNPKRYLIYLN